MAKPISEFTRGYNSGWRRGVSKGKHDALVKVHAICEENGVDASVFPKIPVLDAKSPEKLAAKKQKLQEQLAKIEQMEAQLDEGNEDGGEEYADDVE